MRTALLVTVALAGIAAADPGYGQIADPGPGGRPGAAGADPDIPANGNPSLAERAVRDAIPLTPAMIEDLARRYDASRRAAEQATTEMAAPINRQINVSLRTGRDHQHRQHDERIPDRRQLLRQHRSAVADPVGYQQQSCRRGRRDQLQRVQHDRWRPVCRGGRLLCLHAHEGEQCAGDHAGFVGAAWWSGGVAGRSAETGYLPPAGSAAGATMPI